MSALRWLQKEFDYEYASGNVLALISKATEVSLAERTGWRVICPDLQLVQRDGIIVLQRQAES